MQFRGPLPPPPKPASASKISELSKLFASRGSSQYLFSLSFFYLQRLFASFLIFSS